MGTGGRAKIWGSVPKKIDARYMDGNGNAKNSILLLSGYWGLARHFHYLPELVAAYSWCVPGFGFPILQVLYAVFLTILLIDRAFRDDARCQAKYTKYWDMYRRKV